MSLATSCPACGTVFKVVEDQLKVSEGWVRCGHCHDVFNALEGLFDLQRKDSVLGGLPAPVPREVIAPHGGPSAAVPAGTLAEPRPVNGEMTPAITPAPPEAASVALTTSQAVDSNEPAAATSPTELPAMASDGQSPTTQVRPVPLDLLEADTIIPGDLLFNHEVEENKSEGFTHDPWPATEEAALDALGPPQLAETSAAQPVEQESLPSVDLPSFASSGPRDLAWTPVRRRAAWSAAGALGLLLALQVTWHWREDLAVRSAWLKTPLRAISSILSVPLSAPASADGVEVENAALTHPPGAAGYKLSVQVRNRLDHEVAAPHMELSLTDAAGALVARKILRPEDFQQSASMIPQGEATWSLEFQADERKVAGYTVLAFYP